MTTGKNVVPVRMYRVGIGVTSISCCITDAKISCVYICFSAKHIDVALIIVFNSQLAWSIWCRAARSSVGLSGLLWMDTFTFMPSKRLNTSLTTAWDSLMSWGNADMISCLERPVSTGIKKRTSGKRLSYRFLTFSTSSKVGTVFSVRMWIMRSTSVSEPLGKSCISFSSSLLLMPMFLMGASSILRMTRFTSDMELMYICENGCMSAWLAGIRSKYK